MKLLLSYLLVPSFLSCWRHYAPREGHSASMKWWLAKFRSHLAVHIALQCISKAVLQEPFPIKCHDFDTGIYTDYWETWLSFFKKLWAQKKVCTIYSFKMEKSTKCTKCCVVQAVLACCDVAIHDLRGKWHLSASWRYMNSVFYRNVWRAVAWLCLSSFKHERMIFGLSQKRWFFASEMHCRQVSVLHVHTQYYS